jgi:MSHA biogenesis protein MshQ
MKPSNHQTINHAAFAIALALLLAVLLFAAVQPASADPGWYDAEWAYRKSITIQVSEVVGGSDLPNFPVLISFTDTDLATDAQGNGNDILFTTSTDEMTKLAHEIEEFDGGTGKLIAWVKVTSLSHDSDTVLYMYYNNSKCGSQQDAGVERLYVWR